MQVPVVCVSVQCSVIMSYLPVSSMYPSVPQLDVAGNIKKQDDRRQLPTESR